MTEKKSGPTPIKAFRLGDRATKELIELADALHNGDQTATLREIIRKAHKEEFQTTKTQKS